MQSPGMVAHIVGSVRVLLGAQGDEVAVVSVGCILGRWKRTFFIEFHLLGHKVVDSYRWVASRLAYYRTRHVSFVLGAHVFEGCTTRESGQR